MLTAAEQKEIVRRAIFLVRISAKLKDNVKHHVTDKRYADHLWNSHLDEFKDYLKEVGHVPVSRVSNETQQVDAAEKAHTSNGTQNV